MLIIIGLYYLIILVFFLYFFNKERITPVSIFIVSQGMFFSGLIKYLDFNSNDDIRIALIYLIAIICFVIGALFATHIYPVRRRKVEFIEGTFTKNQSLIIKLLIFISILLFVFFCYKTNFSTIKIMFGNILGQGLNITETRLASYSVPGTPVIYTFRIAILPTIVVAITKCKNYSKKSKIALCIFMIAFSLITGQRGGFVFVMFMWILSFLLPLFYRNSNTLSRKTKKNVVLILMLLFGFFFFLSTINGRVSGSLFGEVIQRFFDDNQGTAYYSFHYIFNEGTCWGRNYYEEIVNLLVPGDLYLPFSKIIFSIMYGSTRGTAPPCLWGSVFYNFSWIGILLFGFIYGVFAQYIGYRLYHRKINEMRGVIYSYMFIDVGMLVAGGPLQLFNNGFVSLVILSYILHVDRRALRLY